MPSGPNTSAATRSHCVESVAPCALSRSPACSSAQTRRSSCAIGYVGPSSGACVDGHLLREPARDRVHVLLRLRAFGPRQRGGDERLQLGRGVAVLGGQELVLAQDQAADLLSRVGALLAEVGLAGDHLEHERGDGLDEHADHEPERGAEAGPAGGP